MDQDARDVASVRARGLRLHVAIAGMLLLMAQCASWAAPASEDTFVCGGTVEAKVWQLWDDAAKAYVSKDELADRLLAKGDTYALYDVQTFTHNLVAMARRCQRVDRLAELAQVFGVAYSVLEPHPDDNSSVAWVCRGGSTCSHRKDLLNNEVMLTSVQFLGLVSSIANGLARAPRHGQGEFVEKTATAGLKHLVRWGDADARALVDKLIHAKARDVSNGSSSELFFTDKELWMITIYAELSGVLQQAPSLRAKAGITERQFTAMRAHLSGLLRLLAARTTVKPVVARNGQTVLVAELDRGYWRLWDEFKYAGYSGSQKPVTCPGPIVRLQPPKRIENLGWDISHARRLVHAFDAIERNRQAMHEVFGIEQSILPSPETVQAFARQIVVRVWNGDASFPLFSNYWSGANGWYRVAYDNGTGSCQEGYPPSFLTDSFATGGYASWSRYVPEIGPLARRLYRLSEAESGPELRFMDKYYPKLGVNASPGNRMIAQLMAWPSLVEAGQ